MNTGSIYQSEADGNVTGGSGSKVVGGLVGENKGSISQSFANGNVDAEGQSVMVGGLVGYNTPDATIINSYETGGVTGGSDVGGIAGANSGSLSYVIALGEVVGSNSATTGGLIGLNNEGTVTGGFATDGSSSGTVVASIPLIGSFTGGMKTGTNSMISYQQSLLDSTYVGFNFSTIWTSYINGSNENGYEPPQLAWQYGGTPQ